jgi:spermidine synthase
VLWVSTAAIFCGACLLFVVEPMVGKLLLPLAGGTPAVWTTAMLFFQVVLLLGYTYAHLVTRLGARVQLAVHLLLLAAVLAVLPIAIPAGWAPPSGWTVMFWLLALLAVVVGLPFFALSSGSPLLQRWFSRSGHVQAADPYFLYRASNLGSVGTLLAYPLLIEAHLGLRAQAWWWAVGYVVFVVLALLTGMLVLRSAPIRPTPTLPALRGGGSVLRWVALAAVPSTWMLALTSYLTTTVLPMPLLWVVPLAIYLLTFAIVFSPRPLVRPGWMDRVLPYLVLPLAGTMAFKANGPVWLLFSLHLAAFATGALALHGRLAAARPGPARLTEFYFWVALGGAAGGLLAAIVAPLFFRGYWEYPLAISAGLVLLAVSRGTRRQAVLDVTLPVLLAAAALLMAWAAGPATGGLTLGGFLKLTVLFTIPALVCFSFVRRPVRFGLGVGAIFLVSYSPLLDPQPVLFVARDFFGVHTVVNDASAGRHLLLDGRVTHGSQNQDPRLRLLPTTYYSPSGPAGEFFEAGGARRVAVIGLGAGTLACYAEPGQSWTFYEIDPAVIQIAQDPRLFSFLSSCAPPGTSVVEGDGRLQIARAPDASFDVIVLDAFGSDNVPAHLLTREAIALYFRKLAPGGSLLANISNQYVNLRPIFADEAAAAGLSCYGRIDTSVTPQQAAEGKVISSWVLVGREPPRLAGWEPVPVDPTIPLWTDDFTNLLRVTRLAQ